MQPHLKGKLPSRLNSSRLPTTRGSSSGQQVVRFDAELHVLLSLTRPAASMQSAPLVRALLDAEVPMHYQLAPAFLDKMRVCPATGDDGGYVEKTGRFKGHSSGFFRPPCNYWQLGIPYLCQHFLLKAFNPKALDPET